MQDGHAVFVGRACRGRGQAHAALREARRAPAPRRGVVDVHLGAVAAKAAAASTARAAAAEAPT